MATPYRILPSLLVNEVYFPWVEKEGFVVDLLRQHLEDDFYQAWEVGTQFLPNERKEIGRLVEEGKRPLTQWLTPMLEGEQLFLSATDEAVRQAALTRVIEQLPLSAEMGASTVAVVSGADPGDDLRQRSLDNFAESLIRVCEVAKTFNMQVILEPLDRFAHKKRVVGFTPDTIALIEKVRAHQPNMGFAFDSAHAALNEEDPCEVIREARHQIAQLHLSNAILDKSDPMYGDFHIPPGEPGFLTAEVASNIVKEALKQGVGKKNGLRVSVESRGHAHNTPEVLGDQVRDFLKRVIGLVESSSLPSNDEIAHHA